MCEFKEKDDSKISNDNKGNFTIATVEGNEVSPNVVMIHKGTEYFETALEATKFGKFNCIIILISGLILSNVLLETLAISFVLPVSQCDLNLTIQQKGVLSAIGFAGIISSSHLWGFLADTRGRRKVIRPTLLFGFLVTLLSSFSTNFWFLVVLRYINGFCVSGGSATIYAYLGEFHTSKSRSRAIMSSAFIFGVGAMMMPTIAWLIINQEWRFVVPLLNITYKPWRFFMVVCGIPGFLCGLALFKIPESPKYLLSKGQEEKALEVLKIVYQLNTGKPKSEFPVAHVIEDLDTSSKPKFYSTENMNAVTALLRSMWSQTQPLFNRLYLRKTILICTIQFWIFVTSNGMYMWFPHILNSVAEYVNDHPNEGVYLCDIVYKQQRSLLKMEELNSKEPNQNGTLTSEAIHEPCNEKLEISTYQHSLMLEVFYAVGFALIGTIINSVGKRLILFVCLAACGACGVAAIFVTEPMAAVYLYLILLLCGLGINVLSAATVDLYPTSLRAMAVCISLMMGRLGSMVGANVFGTLISYHCEAAFFVSGISLILSGLLGFAIPMPSKLNEKGSPRRTSLISMTGN